MESLFRQRRFWCFLRLQKAHRQEKVVCRKVAKHAKKKDKRLKKKKKKIYLCATLCLCGKKEKSSYPVIPAVC
jgi:hypothetical protein